MRILLIGKGGREHALAWKLSQTAEHVYVVPGNGGTATMSPKVTNVAAVNMSDFEGLVKLARELNVDLVVPGPDDVIVDGVADVFGEAGIPCFAPSKAAAELEGSKTYAKDFMQRHNIPTAEYRNFSDYSAASAYLAEVKHRVVIKVSGLAAGKGVVLPETQEEAQEELRAIMVDGRFGAAGTEVMIEEFLTGDEISILTFSDGRTFKSLPPGQDHKRIFDGARGPNTGGMGVYGPTDFVSGAMMERIEREILEPTFQGLRDEGRPFCGILFTGVMVTPAGPKVLEYNVRFGDPETQSLVPLMAPSCDLAKLCLSCIDGSLEEQVLEVQDEYACNVIIVAEGYPGVYRRDDRIEMAPAVDGVHVFHAGTVLRDGELRTAGGRVFAVAAVRETLAEAVEAAYKGVEGIKFPGMQFRRDIGARGLRRGARLGA